MSAPETVGMTASAPAEADLIAAADRLERAAAAGRPCEPVTDLLGDSDIDAAYRVQQTLTQRRLTGGARIVGRKIGLTSAAVQAQIGVAQPDFGVLFDDMRFNAGEEIPFSRLLQPKAEAEVAFLLSHDIENPDALIASEGASALRDAVELAYPALEIVDSRVADWRIGITDTVADNASSGVFVLGGAGVPLGDLDLAEVAMTMLRNGEEVSRGTGRDCLGDPLNALAWLASTLARVGAPLRAGDVVLSGALGPMVPVEPGDTFESLISPLGRVTARFSRKEQR